MDNVSADTTSSNWLTSPVSIDMRALYDYLEELHVHIQRMPIQLIPQL